MIITMHEIRKQDKEGLLVNERIEEFGLNLESLTSSTEYWSVFIKDLLGVEHFEYRDWEPW